MADTQGFILERVDDIPLLLALMTKIQVSVILDKHLGNHGHQTGLSNGWVASVWLAYILSEGQHTKMHVQEWVAKREQLLSQLTGEAVQAIDFTDDGLTLVLKRLSADEKWHGIESELWQGAWVIHQIETTGVRLDSTTSYGYHSVNEEGVMQYGHSKDQRPDLAQLKLMAAVAEPSGQPIACDVVSGEKADDRLYLPLIERARRILRQPGLLYTGDSKMAALAIRANLVFHKDFYLTVLPRTGETVKEWDAWLDAIIDGEQTATLVYRDEQLLGGGYEFSRTLRATLAGQTEEWQERVQLLRSTSQAKTESQALEKRLQQASQALRQLTPAPARGQRQYRDETALQAAIDKVLTRYEVADLLTVTWQREEKPSTRYIGRGRGGPQRPTRTTLQVRYVITDVSRNEQAIDHQRRRLGWRAYVTNLPQAQWTMSDSVCHYRAGYCIERDFHLIKDRPLGLSPLYVHRPDQIVGLTRLLTIALRLLTLLEAKTRHALQESGDILVGLYESQASRATDRPTGLRLLRAFARAEISRVGVPVADQWLWRVTPLSDLLVRILHLLGLPEELYAQLGNST